MPRTTPARYKEAYIRETEAFCKALVNDEPSPCSGEDGLIALVMAIAAGKSASENRWVAMKEMAGELCEATLPSEYVKFSGADACEVAITTDEDTIDFEQLTGGKSPFTSFKNKAKNLFSFGR